jgi:thioredoxin-dependent peroxiredoxin
VKPCTQTIGDPEPPRWLGVKVDSKERHAIHPRIVCAPMAGPDVGDSAPDFTLEGTEGPFTLSEHRGERVVLLFYPGDDTTVCTKQFCAYRDAADEMAELDAVFVGISVQGMGSKEAFRSKYGLTTPLLADRGGEVSKAYGVFSNRFKAAKRTVFIVDEDGNIAHRHGNLMSATFDDVDELKAALAKLPART